jgi:hypothetical protein
MQCFARTIVLFCVWLCGRRMVGRGGCGAAVEVVGRLLWCPLPPYRGHLINALAVATVGDFSASLRSC